MAYVVPSSRVVPTSSGRQGRASVVPVVPAYLQIRGRGTTRSGGGITSRRPRCGMTRKSGLIRPFTPVLVAIQVQPTSRAASGTLRVVRGG